MLTKFLNKQRMKKHYKTVKKVNALEEEVSQLSQEELINKTREFQSHLKTLEKPNEIEHYLNKILPYAFAMVRESANRTLNMRHFDVQLIGGEILHEGDISEMKTGEGKTLVITLPTYLNALVGKGVHVVTVNDYLAKRDMEKMSVVHEYLGLTVGLVQNEMDFIHRRENYNKDITYVTNSEIGFDYLRDNLTRDIKHKVLIKGLYYCIIDEVDSILIDEARTPLIISGQGKLLEDLYIKADKFARSAVIDKKVQQEFSKLERTVSKSDCTIKYDGDAVVDKKERTIILTDNGIAKAEKFFDIDNLGNIEHSPIMHHIMQSLKAHNLFTKDTDYLIRDNKIEIIDEFTGRVLQGRKYSEGLHQAIETKENVSITPDSKTLASVTYQNLFRLYNKKSGLTGTAKTEETEFYETHNMMVVEVPTNKPILRIDHADKVYKTKKEKYLLVAKEIKKCYQIGRPVLIGTPNVYVSEVIDEILTRMDIPHTVLNAKNHELEAEIISKAGEVNAITVATNMAGRGTDIQLSEKSKELGGLLVIGVERNDSRRIDNQLRGRSGRQGDKGDSIFYLSLEDDLMKLFANNNAINTLFAMSVEYGEAIESKMLSSAIENAQKQIEGIHYEQRKHVVQYDEIISKQRNIVYDDRNKLLEGDVIENYSKLIAAFIDDIDEQYYDSLDVSKDAFIKEKIKEYLNLSDLSIYSNDDIIENEDIEKFFTDKLTSHSKDIDTEIIKSIVLSVVDDKWTNYLDVVDEIQKGAGMASYKQQDPVLEFIKVTQETFSSLILDIQVSIIKKIHLFEFDNEK